MIKRVGSALNDYRRGNDLILVFKHGTSEKAVHNVEAMLTEEGCRVFINEHNNQFQIGLLGASDLLNKIKKLPEIEGIRESHRTLKLTSREFHPQDSIIELGDVAIGGDQPIIMAGPCSVESEDQILNVASFLKGLGVQVLRGGAFKPRTSPYSFQGLQERGLQLLNKARHQTGMSVISEVMDASQILMMQEYVDILQVGSRNMQNFYLLKELGKIDKPVMLKRGGSSTIDEWLLAAEYIMAEGNTQVILCERGIRSIESYTRNTLDLNADRKSVV